MVHPTSVTSQFSRLSRPSVIDDIIWKIMQKCWSPDSPSISDILKNISQYLTILPSDENSSVVRNKVIRTRPSIFDLPNSIFPTSTLPILLGQGESALSLSPTDLIIVYVTLCSQASSFRLQLY